MTTLLLLRHAKSSWDDTSLSDIDRPLSQRGRRAAARLAEHMRRERIRPDVVLCSSALRTRETLEIVATGVESSPVTLIEEGLYGADSDQLLARLRRIEDGVDMALVVGHNPTLQDLALGLAGSGEAEAMARLEEKFPTGALARLSFRPPWHELNDGGARLESLVVPRELD